MVISEVLAARAPWLSLPFPPYRRPWRAIELSLLVSAFLALFYNHRFWQILTDNTSFSSLHEVVFVAAAYLFVTLWLSLFIHLTTIRHLFKPLLILLLLISASADYFSSRYGVIIDRSMIQNLVQTDVREATELASIGLFLHLLGYVLLPAVVIANIPLRRQPLKRELYQRLAAYLAALAVMAALFFGFNQDFTFLFRQHPELRSLITPTYPIHAAIKYWRERDAEPEAREPIGGDAHQAEAFRRLPKKTLLVFVAGETARAENFSLNGYARKTNPELASLDVLNFRNTRACGTSTAESLPCMFSHLGREDYDSHTANRYENLLDVLAHAGVESLWIDNQSGCKGVCTEVETIATRELDDPESCPEGECYDEEMLKVLDERIFQGGGAAARDRFVVLHQMGSHGPAYYKRVPGPFRRFTPECRSVNLQDCSREQLVNSYDNTILYTDYLLARLIRLLDSHRDEYDILLYYVSDHGESLGENGLYLHGMPYLFAPEQQTRVPALLWLSEGFSRDHAIARRCLARHLDDESSHDNVFHTVLGAFGIETGLYQPAEDLLAACRQPGRMASVATAGLPYQP